LIRLRNGPCRGLLPCWTISGCGGDEAKDANSPAAMTRARGSIRKHFIASSSVFPFRIGVRPTGLASLGGSVVANVLAPSTLGSGLSFTSLGSLVRLGVPDGNCVVLEGGGCGWCASPTSCNFVLGIISPLAEFEK
jgi:hypothetical protein